MWKRALTLSAISLLTACGGGGGGGGGAAAVETRVVTTNTAPTAVAIAAAEVTEQSLVTLDGSTSGDADGEIVAYRWTQRSGPTVTLVQRHSVEAHFTAPVVEDETTLEFELRVEDDEGLAALDTVAVRVQPATFGVSGTISAARGTSMDGDVNDPNAAYTPNDEPAQAQPISNPATVGGYLTAPGAGEPGPLQAAGDVSDYYRVDVLAGQTITLMVADPARGDPDLYLWEATGSVILDSSLNTGAIDAIDVVHSGEVLIEVAMFDGASSYTLIIGQSRLAGVAGQLRLSDDIVPGEIVVARKSGSAAARATVATSLVQQPSDGPELVRLGAAAMGLAHMQAQPASGGSARAAALPDEAARAKYATHLAIKALRKRDPSLAVQPNFLVQPMATIPADPLYRYQWHYPMIDLPGAWDVSQGDAGVTVAVIDTGILADHPDLIGQLSADGFDFISDATRAGDGDGIDSDPHDTGDGVDGQQSSFHGTHVAGTVGARSNNEIGGVGVAAGAKVLPLRVLGTGGGTTYDILQAIRYAAGLSNDSGQVLAQPVDVMNLSLGRTGACDAGEQAVIDAAREAGVVVVVAAGNAGVDAANHSPANCNNVVTVGAVDLQGNRAPYSNFGSLVDVLAPGGDTSNDRDGDGYPDGVLSTLGDDSASPTTFTHAFLQGTSMASPHVAGVMALMKSVNPALTPEQIDQLLADGALTNAAGIINAQRAVFAALDAAGLPSPENPMLAVTPGSLNFDSTFTLAELDVHVSGGGDLSANPPTVNASWLTVTPIQIDTDNIGRYAVAVDRSGLSQGTHSATITITSTVNTVKVPVILQVRESEAIADAGHLYVILVDAQSGERVDQVELNASSGFYTYAFEGVPDGAYEIIAGTDIDNDFTICDSGEVCGGFPTSYQPEVIVLDDDVSGLDFPVGHVVALAQGSSAEADHAKSAAAARDSKGRDAPAVAPVKPLGPVARAAD